MIPDKIYFGYDEGVHLESYCLEKKGKCQLEYVRKDALLEKLEKVAAEYKKRSDEGDLVWQNMCGINEAIDKLNEM